MTSDENLSFRGVNHFFRGYRVHYFGGRLLGRGHELWLALEESESGLFTLEFGIDLVN